ncbi:hypothetical protein ACRAWF_30245 [Streptomyces sp. L7]
MTHLPEETSAPVMRAIGRRFDPASTTEESLRAARAVATVLWAPRAERVTRDLAYGPDPRHLLDVHTPATVQEALLVLALCPRRWVRLR